MGCLVRQKIGCLKIGYPTPPPSIPFPFHRPSHPPRKLRGQHRENMSQPFPTIGISAPKPHPPASPYPVATAVARSSEVRVIPIRDSRLQQPVTVTQESQVWQVSYGLCHRAYVDLRLPASSAARRGDGSMAVVWTRQRFLIPLCRSSGDLWFLLTESFAMSCLPGRLSPEAR